MAGFIPNEGEALIANLVFNNADADRGTNLELGLFTNSSVDETITEATITEPTGGSYARKTLTDASWTGTADARAYAKQTFTATGGAFTGSIYGYFIATTGTTPRLLVVEVDSGGPYTFAENEFYEVTPTNTVA